MPISQSVELIDVTKDAEMIIMRNARVSNPNNEKSTNTNILKYCFEKAHWSIFEQSYMTIRIETSRAMSAQLIRHKSFSFQEFSQRYAKVMDYVVCEPRRQDLKNRQNSINDLAVETMEWFAKAQDEHFQNSMSLYNQCLEKGVAKECARMLLPMSSKTVVNMSGNIRSWIHYLQVRMGPDTQAEHREIASAIAEIFKKELPTIGALL